MEMKPLPMDASQGESSTWEHLWSSIDPSVLCPCEIITQAGLQTLLGRVWALNATSCRACSDNTHQVPPSGAGWSQSSINTCTANTLQHMGKHLPSPDLQLMEAQQNLGTAFRMSCRDLAAGEAVEPELRASRGHQDLPNEGLFGRRDGPCLHTKLQAKIGLV